MVSRATCIAAWAWLGASEEKKLPIQRLDPETRTKVVMALTGLVLLWFLIVVLIMLAGRWARSYINQPPRLFGDRKRSGGDADDWARKPLTPPHDEDDEP